MISFFLFFFFPLLFAGTFSFGAGYCSSFSFATPPVAVAGKYDFVGVALHEITEIMGRIPALGYNFGSGSGSYYPYDLFRYVLIFFPPRSSGILEFS